VSRLPSGPAPSDMLVLRGQLCLVLVQLLAMPGLPTALSLDIAP
jgi:hypothetical protein